MSTLHTRSVTGSTRQTARDPRSRPTSVYAWSVKRPFVVSILEHAVALHCHSLLPDMDAEVAGLRCASPGCCNARQLEVYHKIAAYAEQVRRWKFMVNTPGSIAVGIAKVGSNFEERVRNSIRTTVTNVSILWLNMYTQGLVAKAPVRILAPLYGGPAQPIDDIVNALPPDVLTVVIAQVIKTKMNAGEPVGNICRLRRTCIAFATHPLFEPFMPRIVLRRNHALHGTSDPSAFPHRPCGATPSDLATVCTRRQLSVNLQLSLPGDPASERLLAVEGGPAHGGVDLAFSLQATHRDDSTHDVTDRLMQKRSLSRRALNNSFRLDGTGLRACVRFQFGLLSSTVDRELRDRCSRQLSTLASAASDKRQPVLGEVATVARVMRLERGETVTDMKRIRKRDRKALASPFASPFARHDHGPCPPQACSDEPLSSFRFVVVPLNPHATSMPFLRWVSEPFTSGVT